MASTLGELEEKLRGVGEKLLSSPHEDGPSLLKLIHEAEEYILKVEQAPPESTVRAMTPAMAALVKKELLSHSTYEVQLSAVSCISEITRITAPDTPYGDDVMKDVFSIMVGSFEKLDDTESPLFKRIVAILETVAKVRLCVVMLDLECGDLIQQMFKNFFTTVKSNHSETVVSCMTSIMKLVIEEDEDIDKPIAECLLQHSKIEMKESSAASFQLAEKVIEGCSFKLKPVFRKLLQGAPLNIYSSIIKAICEDNSDVKEDPSVKDMVDDGKLSERTISDELPQDPSKLDEDVTQTTAFGSGATPVDNGTEAPAANPKELSNLDVDTVKDGVKQSPKVANGAADGTSEPVDGTPVVLKPRRGRPPALKSLEKKAVGTKGLGLKKVETTESAGKSTKRSPKPDAKPSTRKASGGGSSQKQQKISLKQQKDETDSKEDTAKDISLKDMVMPKSISKSSARTKSNQGQESTGTKRKRSQEDELETPRSRKNKGLDASLVGARIQVWWPDDKKFYKGVVDSFDTASKRHKIAYDDGDVEVLLLRDEKWEFASEEQDKTPDVASEISPKPRGRSRKGRGSSVQLKEGNAETPKSGGVDLPKKRGRPKGSSSNTPKSNISATSSKSIGKAARKDANETPALKKEAEKGSEDNASQSAEKKKDDLPEDGSNKSASKAKEASSGGKDLKDESKPSEGKAKPGRKPKATAAAVVAGEESKANVSAEIEKRKETEGDSAEVAEQEGSAGGASTGGKKRRRKA
uniref:Tudor domain-containing protein n=1 Tax=Leersia perrieri TaxID=77586 RepID=A0A0D9VI84_9ORYZ